VFVASPIENPINYTKITVHTVTKDGVTKPVTSLNEPYPLITSGFTTNLIDSVTEYGLVGPYVQGLCGLDAIMSGTRVATVVTPCNRTCGVGTELVSNPVASPSQNALNLNQTCFYGSGPSMMFMRCNIQPCNPLPASPSLLSHSQGLELLNMALRGTFVGDTAVIYHVYETLLTPNQTKWIAIGRIGDVGSLAIDASFSFINGNWTYTLFNARDTTTLTPNIKIADGATDVDCDQGLLPVHKAEGSLYHRYYNGISFNNGIKCGAFGLVDYDGSVPDDDSGYKLDDTGIGLVVTATVVTAGVLVGTLVVMFK